jgi:hypothetical protein
MLIARRCTKELLHRNAILVQIEVMKRLEVASPARQKPGDGGTSRKIADRFMKGDAK